MKTQDKLDQYLAEISEELMPIQPDEFTAIMLKEKLEQAGFYRAESTIRLKLRYELKEGLLTRRMGNVNGNRTGIYKPVTK